MIDELVLHGLIEDAGSGLEVGPAPTSLLAEAARCRPRRLGGLRVLSVAAALTLVGGVVVASNGLGHHRTGQASGVEGPELGVIAVPPKLQAQLLAHFTASPTAYTFTDVSRADVLASVDTPAGSVKRLAFAYTTDRGSSGTCRFDYLFTTPDDPLPNGGGGACGPIGQGPYPNAESPVWHLGITRTTVGSLEQKTQTGILGGDAPANAYYVRIVASNGTTKTVRAYSSGSRNGNITYFLTDWPTTDAATVEALTVNDQPLEVIYNEAARPVTLLPTRLASILAPRTVHVGEALDIEVQGCPRTPLPLGQHGVTVAKGLRIGYPPEFSGDHVLRGTLIPTTWRGGDTGITSFTIPAGTFPGNASLSVICDSGTATVPLTIVP